MDTQINPIKAIQAFVRIANEAYTPTSEQERDLELLLSVIAASFGVSTDEVELLHGAQWHIVGVQAAGVKVEVA